MQVAPIAPMVELPGLDPKTILLEVPVNDLWDDTAAMLRATRHRHTLVNGFSGYGPPHYGLVFEGLKARDPSVIEAWRRFGPLAVLVSSAKDPDGKYDAFVSQIPDAMLTYRTPLGPVYRFSPLPVPQGSPGSLLPIARISVSENSETAFALTDGAHDTQWKTFGPQVAGHQLRIGFDGERRISRLEMDLAETIMDYPRELRIEARRGDGNVVTLWHSGTAGLAAVGLINDRVRLPLTIDLPSRPAAEELILTLTKGDDTYFWTIAELRVYGQ
jgi:hypothetical protein